jgi:hypothetical protein
VPDDSIYIFDCATMSEYRGMGIYPAILAKICKNYPQMDKWIACSARNHASIRGIQKVGFRKSYSFITIMIFKFRIRFKVRAKY